MNRDDVKNLMPGDEGYWPVIAAMPQDIRVGDRMTIDSETFIVDVSRPGKSPLRWAILPVGGEVFTIGALNRDWVIDRWGTHAHLADSCR